MRIGLVSDTHIPDIQKELPAEVSQAFHGVDLILHAGDIYVTWVLDELERIAPVLAARGDDDYGGTLLDARVKVKHILQLDGQTVWLVHERPYYLMSAWRQLKAIPGPEEDAKPDIVVFGHEHSTFLQHVDGILCVCSGSPTFLHYLRGLGTVGILDIDADNAEARIVQL